MYNLKNVLIYDSAYVEPAAEDVLAMQAHFSLPNPAWVSAQRMGIWYTKDDKTLEFMRPCPNKPGTFKLPRNFMHLLHYPPDMKFPINDKTSEARHEFDWVSNTSLYDYQVAAVSAYLAQNGLYNGTGIISLACGKGKTVAALYLMTLLEQKTLVLVDQESLARQWHEQIKKHLGINATFWMSTKKEVSQVTIATLQSLHSHDKNDVLPKNFFENFGLTILDECHVAPAVTYSAVMSKVRSKYILGLSATTERNDGLTDIVSAYCGPVVYKDLGTDLAPKILFHFFETIPPNFDKRLKNLEKYYSSFIDKAKARKLKEVQISRLWGQFITELTEFEPRNRIILENIATDYHNGHVVLVLSSRVEHCEYLHQKLTEKGILAAQLKGSVPEKKRQIIMQQIKDGELKVLLATSVAKKGLDLPPVSSVHLTCPQGSEEYIVQSIGRGLRNYPGKSSVLVRDYVDSTYGMSLSLYRKRTGIYKRKGWMK